MRISRVLASTTLAGVLFFSAAPKARAIEPTTQDLLSQLLFGMVLGAPAGAPGALSGGYGLSPYDPYDPSAYDPYQNGRYGSYGAPPYYDVYRDRERRYRSERQVQYDYEKAMRRLDRQEAEARAKAYRKSRGNPERYYDRMAKIERKYAHKRYKVERNTARRYGYR
jgi:hypothetical protein